MSGGMGGSGAANRIYLVDGTSQLFRAYFAIGRLSNPQGLPTNAVYGFATMLRRLLKEEKPAYLGVAFDLAGPTFRHGRYADYKAHRPPPPEDLSVQVPYAKDLCRAMNIPVLELEGYEADDLIATYTRLAREAGFEVVIVASDKDLLQLVGEAVTVLNPAKNIALDARGVAQSFGVGPDRVLDVLALMGDSVDNIPGVPGVGEKSAKELVARHGPLEAILERAERLAAAYEEKDELLGLLERLDAPEAAAAGLADRLEALAGSFEQLLPGEPEERRGRVEEAISASRQFARALRSGEVLPGPQFPREARRLARLLRDLDRGSGRRIWTAVRDHREQALLSRELAALDRNVPVAFDPDRFRLGPPDTERLRTLYRVLDFRSLLEELEGETEETEAGAIVLEGRARPRYRTVLDSAALREVAAACRAAAAFSVDTETDGTDPLRARLVGISVSWEEGQAAYVPLGHTYLGAPPQLSLDSVRAELGPLFGDPSLGKVGQNLKFDLHVLRRHGLEVEGWRLDTMVAAFLLNPDRGGFTLDSLAREYLGIATIPYEEVAGRGPDERTLDRVEIERVTEYAAEDADVTLRLARVLEPRLAEAGLRQLYETVDGPLIPVLARMEARGIRVDVERLRRMSRELEESLERLRAEIHDLAGVRFNVDSPKQLRDVLFEKLRLKSGRLTAKGGVPSTDARTLEELAAEHEIARKILDYRELAKLKNTYADQLPGLLHPDTGRVHTCYHPTGAATGRLSSSEPNLQNIPARTEAGRKIRSAFVAEPGMVFLASDYSQMELRVLAHLSGDPELVAAFQAGEDIHRRTAARIFGVDPALVSEDMRRRAKAVNFGILYGMSESRLAREQGISRAEARRFIATYFERFRGVADYIERVRETARRDGAVRTLFGRVRYFASLKGKPGRAVEEAALRAAVNTTIQGTAADLMKMAMLRVDGALREAAPGAHMLLQVHDELLFEVPQSQVEAAASAIREAMEGVHPLRIRLAVDQKVGRSWLEVT